MMTMQRQRGATISEYMLILALVVLVAIPAVAYMGGSLSNGYTDADPTTKAQGLFSLLDANPAALSGPGGTGFTPIETSGGSGVCIGPCPDGTGTLSAGYATQTFDTSSAMTTTSAAGTTDTIAATLQHIADTGAMPNGDPVPAGFDTQKIADLADRGHDIAAGITDLSNDRLVTQGEMDALTGEINGFLNQYDTLEQYVNGDYGNDPAAAALLQEITDYAAVIKSSAVESQIIFEQSPAANFKMNQLRQTNVPDAPASSDLAVITDDVNTNSTNIDNTQGQASQL